jgi:hypothetical protein
MRVTFSADIELPDGTPSDHIQEWMEFELGVRCDLSLDNALADTDMESIGCRYVTVQS